MASDTKFITYLISIGVVAPTKSSRIAKSDSVFCFSFKNPRDTQRNLTSALGRPTREPFMFGGKTADSLLFRIEGKGTVRVAPKLLEGNLTNVTAQRLTSDQMIDRLKHFEMDPGNGYGVAYPVAPALKELLSNELTVRSAAILLMRNAHGSVAQCYKREYGVDASPDIVEFLTNTAKIAKKKAPALFAAGHAQLRKFAVDRLSRVTDADIEVAVGKYMKRWPSASEKDAEDLRASYRRAFSASQQSTHTLELLLTYLAGPRVLRQFQDQLNDLKMLSSAIKAKDWYS